jgi:hypothetical protein
MSVTFQISICRVLTPEEGQLRLAEIHAQARAQGISGIGYVRAGQANVSENPFPQWLTEQIKNNSPGIKFDEVNFFFHCEFESLEEAQHLEQWIRGSLTQWAERDAAKAAVMRTLHTRTMRDYAGAVPVADIDVF